MKYYTQFIQAHEDWQFVDIYADQGITGTRAEKREDFLRLMRDCRQGKIDRILVKSVSRFARNAEEVFNHCIIQTVPILCCTPFALSIRCWYCQSWSEWKISSIPSDIVVKALVSMIVTMLKTGRSEMV